MPRHRATPEGDVKTAVLDLLAAERVFVLRVNSGDLLLTAPNGSKRLVKLAPKGTADILAIVPDPRGAFMPLWVETKSSKGGMTLDQEWFRDDVIERGHSWILARSSDDVLDWIRRFRCGR